VPNISLPPLPILDILSYAATFVFMFWPLIIISPLQRRRHILFNMLFVWCILAVVRVFLFFVPNTVPSFLIPEPLNTVLFFVAGAVLVLIRLGVAVWKARQFQHKADGVNSVDDLLRLSPTEFEQMVVELYQSLGHQAKHTGAVGDHGVDVVVQAQNGEKWVVQCKRWRGMVGEPVIRDFYGVMHHEKADQGAIITAGRFTPQAQEWARGKPIHLYDGVQFLNAWRRARAKQQNQATA